ncbi:hypothetical protein [Hathewaya massiliensis]|uniref:hypothetical protein n=1 Tax=Hathewaya massiliensis TaxID=1964382 RepID=UPI0011573D54|nr:hypothetical protein [Hathewaya massiliensis]
MTEKEKDLDQEKYDLIFENAYNDFIKTMKEDPNYSIESLESLLESMYIVQGNDQLGRGSRHDISINATIAAAETVLYEWRKQLRKSKQ